MSKAKTAAPVVVTTPLNNVPAALWKRAEKAAKTSGQTMDEFIREAVEEKLATAISKASVKRLAKQYGRLPKLPELPADEFTIFDAEGDRNPGWVRLSCREKTGQLFFNGKPISDRDAFLLWVHYEVIEPVGLTLPQPEALFEVFLEAFRGTAAN